MSFKIGLPFICLFFALSLFDGVKYPFMLVTAVIIHEMGHIAAARIVKAPISSLKCGIQGFSLEFDFSTISYIKEFFIIISGSIFGLCSAVTAYGISRDFAYFSAVSAVMSIINLLPICGLDGGEALYCILDAMLLPDRAYRISRAVSWVAAIFFWICVIWIQLRIHPNLSLLAAAMYFIWRSIRCSQS